MAEAEGRNVDGMMLPLVLIRFYTHGRVRLILPAPLFDGFPLARIFHSMKYAG